MHTLNRKQRDALCHNVFLMLQETNKFREHQARELLIEILETTIKFLSEQKIQMIEYPDFFQSGYLKKKDKDIYHYLDRQHHLIFL